MFKFYPTDKYRCFYPDNNFAALDAFLQRIAQFFVNLEQINDGEELMSSLKRV